MAQYRRGTVSTTANSSVITGQLTEWTTYVSPGDLIVIDDDLVTYQIATVDSDTQLTLTSPYPTTKSDVDYSISTAATPNYKLPKISPLDTNSSQYITDGFVKIDQAVKERDDKIDTEIADRSHLIDINPTNHGQHRVKNHAGNTVIDITDSYTVYSRPTGYHAFVIFDTSYRFRHSNIFGDIISIYDNNIYFTGFAADGSTSTQIRLGHHTTNNYSFLVGWDGSNWDFDGVRFYRDPAPGDPRVRILSSKTGPISHPAGWHAFPHYYQQSVRLPDGQIQIEYTVRNDSGSTLPAHSVIGTITEVTHRPIKVVGGFASINGSNITRCYIGTDGTLKLHGDVPAGYWVSLTMTYYRGF